MKKHILGIDLGTSFSEVARVTESGAVEMIPNPDGDVKTASVVSWAGKTPVVGKGAMPDLVLAPTVVMQCGKRSMGKRTKQGKPIPILVGPAGQEITAVDFSAAILAYLKQSAETFLGDTVSKAVITVPAYFDGPAREDTVAAAKIAGFEEVRLLNEPEAAAIYYGLEKATNQTLAVVDTGGGTTDVTAIEVAGSRIETLHIDGDAELGGSNYDEATLQIMRKAAKKAGLTISPEADLGTFYRNLERAQEAKEMLSRREEYTVVVEAEGQRLRVDLTRKDLRRAAKDLDERFTACCKRLQDKLKAEGQTLDRVILVGGNSRWPHIAELVQGVFGLEPARDVDPDLVVAKGAAIYAAVCFGDKNTQILVGGHLYLADVVVVKTVAAHALCVAARRGKRDPEEYNCEIVPAGVSLPYDFEERFSPVHPGQRGVMVKIVQGQPGALSRESSLLREIRVPIQPSDNDDERILVKGRYTADGLLKLTVIDDLLGQPVSDSFIHTPGLSSAEIEQKSGDATGQTQGGR